MRKAISLLKNLQSNDVKLIFDNGKLKIDVPKGILSEETKAKIKAHKTEIIEYLKMLVMRDFCAVCKSRLYEQRNQWFCPKNCR